MAARVDAATDPVPRFDDDHVDAGITERDRGGQTCDACADHSDPLSDWRTARCRWKQARHQQR